jgi:hypothetical protein
MNRKIQNNNKTTNRQIQTTQNENKNKRTLLLDVQVKQISYYNNEQQGSPI